MQKIVSIMVSLLMIALASCGEQRGHKATSDVGSIKALSAKRAQAFNEGNADDIATAFTESGLLMAPGMRPLKGREAIRQYYQDIFTQYKTFLESGYEEVNVSGDIAYGIGYAKVKLVPHAGGDTIVSSAKYVNLLHRQDDGSWLTTHDIWNGNEQ